MLPISLRVGAALGDDDDGARPWATRRLAPTGPLP